MAGITKFLDAFSKQMETSMHSPMDNSRAIQNFLGWVVIVVLFFKESS